MPPAQCDVLLQPLMYASNIRTNSTSSAAGSRVCCISRAQPYCHRCCVWTAAPAPTASCCSCRRTCCRCPSFGRPTWRPPPSAPPSRQVHVNTLTAVQQAHLEVSRWHHSPLRTVGAPACSHPVQLNCCRPGACNWLTCGAEHHALHVVALHSVALFVVLCSA